MKKLITLAAVALSCGAALAQNWTMDGGDNARSGWAKDETVLTKDNVKDLTLLWSTQTDVKPHALHALMTPLAIHGLKTASGDKNMLYVLGVSDVIYAFDADTGAEVWRKTFEPAPPQQQGPPGMQRSGPSDPRHMNFLGPGGTTGVPAISDADSSGKRTVYMVDGKGNVVGLDAATGELVFGPVATGVINKFGVQLYKDQVIFGDYHGRGGIISVDLKTKTVHKTVGFAGGGGLWGRRGPVITDDGTVWTTTGDGIYDVTTDPKNPLIGNSVVGFELQADGNWHPKDWFTPPNWDWLRKRDLDPNNTPTVFHYKGRELMAASGKECKVYLLDPKNLGGTPDHHTPLYRTELFCNFAADFQNAGSWGAVSSWEDKAGTRWVVVPFWGPAAPEQTKFPITQTPAAKEGGVAAFKVADKAGKVSLEPVWISRDMFRGEPPVIANGMIITHGSGDNTQQAWPDIGLNFDSTIRAAKSNHATVYVLDGETGKELWSSGDTITGFNHFTDVTISNGKLYAGTYDGKIYCFGLKK
ncbi:MAG: PQQ-binding-like beta-propeller repeat protein [Acidobacteria bacterium]|nr:PQQ-binding-like beta-propeller repeat protein [Acidobacteriota bacterium]